MYHGIVRRRVASLFEAVNRGDAGPVLAAFGPKFEHVFLGESALGGLTTGGSVFGPDAFGRRRPLIGKDQKLAARCQDDPIDSNRPRILQINPQMRATRSVVL